MKPSTPDDRERGADEHRGALDRHELGPRRHDFASLRPVY